MIGLVRDKIHGVDTLPKIDEDVFNKIRQGFIRKGGVIEQSPDIDAHLSKIGAEAATLNAKTIIIKSDLPTSSAMYEELIHTAQYRAERANGSNWIDMEIEAKQKLVRNQKAYKISDIENEQTKAQLEDLIKAKKVS